MDVNQVGGVTVMAPSLELMVPFQWVVICDPAGRVKRRDHGPDAVLPALVTTAVRQYPPSQVESARHVIASVVSGVVGVGLVGAGAGAGVGVGSGAGAGPTLPAASSPEFTAPAGVVTARAVGAPVPLTQKPVSE